MRLPTISARTQYPLKSEEPPNPVDPELTGELSEVRCSFPSTTRFVPIHYSATNIMSPQSASNGNESHTRNILEKANPQTVGRRGFVKGAVAGIGGRPPSVVATDRP